ncbi:MAG: hypothetical protein EBZ49_07605, partial [Proteobacteria bacterium]|nr:hypothetical protein [Pseudomonadota bacterium]
MLKTMFQMGVVSFSVAILLSGCSDSSSSSTSAFSNAIGAISTSIQVAGASMQTGVLSSHRISPSDCNIHGYPNVNQSDQNYPGHLTYCFLTVDSGDTVRGG